MRSSRTFKKEHVVYAFIVLFCVWLRSVFVLICDPVNRYDLEKDLMRDIRNEAENGTTDNITLVDMDSNNLEIKNQPIDFMSKKNGTINDQNEDTAMTVDESNMELIQEPKYYIKVNKDATMGVEAEVQTQSLRGGDGNHTNHTFYSFLQSRECLPSELCANCLNNGMACSECVHCRCFCEHLCQGESPANVQKIFHYHPSPEIDLGQHNRAKDKGKRLIPKIVHQTWKEHITPELYPKKNVFQSSWKQKGWEHRFYTDDDVITFIKTHFPQEVLEAYNILIPTAFKADLFRYCVLFIYGGVYADYDVLCESDLDHAIDPEVGFFVPVDIDRCLWNGLIGSIPGHPFIAAAIETVVNYVRNRYTSVDIMNSLCHEGKVDYDTSHEDLHLSGPCLLGKVANQVLGRPLQSKYDIHESYDLWLEELGIPGDLQLLEYQKNHFLGGERFILPSKNLIVAGTTFPNAKDNVEKKTPGKHYSSILRNKKGRIFGSFDVYQDMVSVNEDIRLVRTTTSEQE